MKPQDQLTDGHYSLWGEGEETQCCQKQFVAEFTSQGVTEAV